MSITEQHPAVVLRSHHQQLRALLAIAMIAVVGLSAAVVVLATTGPEPGSASSVPAATAPPLTIGTTRYDGGPEEGTRGAFVTPVPPTRRDGGPDEGTRGPSATPPASSRRYDGGPDEGTRGVGR